jgi:hypothetical protein
MVIRGFALWAGLKLVIGTPMLVMAFKDQSEAFGLGLLCVLLAVEFLVIALAWVFADKIARLALTRPSDHVFESDIDPSTWFGLILAAIGAWHLFDAVLQGSRFWMQYRISAGMGEVAAEAATSLKWQFASYVLEAVVSVSLILGGRGLAAALHRLRYAGTAASRDG